MQVLAICRLGRWPCSRRIRPAAVGIRVSVTSVYVSIEVSVVYIVPVNIVHVHVVAVHIIHSDVVVIHISANTVITTDVVVIDVAIDDPAIDIDVCVTGIDIVTIANMDMYARISDPAAAAPSVIIDAVAVPVTIII